jgi:hypothetical protein
VTSGDAAVLRGGYSRPGRPGPATAGPGGPGSAARPADRPPAPPARRGQRPRGVGRAADPEPADGPAGARLRVPFPGPRPGPGSSPGRSTRCGPPPGIEVVKVPPHQARNLRPPDSDDIPTSSTTDITTARIRRQRVLGGVINEYQRQPDHRKPAAKSQLRGYCGVMDPHASQQGDDHWRITDAGSETRARDRWSLELGGEGKATSTASPPVGCGFTDREA